MGLLVSKHLIDSTCKLSASVKGAESPCKHQGTGKVLGWLKSKDFHIAGDICGLLFWVSQNILSSAIVHVKGANISATIIFLCSYVSTLIAANARYSTGYKYLWTAMTFLLWFLDYPNKWAINGACNCTMSRKMRILLFNRRCEIHIYSYIHVYIYLYYILYIYAYTICLYYGETSRTSHHWSGSRQTHQNGWMNQPADMESEMMTFPSAKLFERSMFTFHVS